MIILVDKGRRYSIVNSFCTKQNQIYCSQEEHLIAIPTTKLDAIILVKDVLYHASDVWTTIKWDIMLRAKCFIASIFSVVYFAQQG